MRKANFGFSTLMSGFEDFLMEAGASTHDAPLFSAAVSLLSSAAKVISPGFADSIPASPVISTSDFPSIVPPKRAATFFISTALLKCVIKNHPKPDNIVAQIGLI
jgi:hypothetical protein